MNWERLKREISSPRRIFNLTKLGYLNYLQWPVGAVSYFVIIYSLGLHYIFPSLTVIQGSGIFGVGIVVSFTVGLAMKLHKGKGLFVDEQAMTTEANPYARINYEIQLKSLNAQIASMEANIKWLDKDGIDSSPLRMTLPPLVEAREKVREILLQWG